jgi:vacuolar protein sorting-associated protein 3
VTNLVKNYTPHLQPNTRSAPPTSELRKLLVVSARDMLREYLRKWKNKVLYSGEPAVKETSQVRLQRVCIEVADRVIIA